MKRVALIVVLLMWADTSVAADKVRLSISAVDISFLTAGLASKRGFFRDEGLDVEIIRMNANVSITALSTGNIDYTMIFASVVRGALRGMPMKVVSSYMDSSTHLLIARPAGIQISERLEGQNPCGQHVWRDLRRCGADDVQTRRCGPRAGTENYSSWGGKIALHRFARGNRGRGCAIAPGGLGSNQAWL